MRKQLVAYNRKRAEVRKIQIFTKKTRNQKLDIIVHMKPI